MALKRTIEESTEELPKVPRLEAPSMDYLLPIEFVRNGTSPCISEIAAALFDLEAGKVRRVILHPLTLSLKNSNL